MLQPALGIPPCRAVPCRRGNFHGTAETCPPWPWWPCNFCHFSVLNDTPISAIFTVTAVTVTAVTVRSRRTAAEKFAVRRDRRDRGSVRRGKINKKLWLLLQKFTKNIAFYYHFPQKLSKKFLQKFTKNIAFYGHFMQKLSKKHGFLWLSTGI